MTRPEPCRLHSACTQTYIDTGDGVCLADRAVGAALVQLEDLDAVLRRVALDSLLVEVRRLIADDDEREQACLDRAASACWRVAHGLAPVAVVIDLRDPTAPRLEATCRTHAAAAALAASHAAEGRPWIVAARVADVDADYVAHVVVGEGTVAAERHTVTLPLPRIDLPVVDDA